MPKRRCVLLLLVVWIGSGGVAHAALTATPISIGSITVGQSGTATGTLSANPVETVATFDLGAPGCSEFQVTTTTPLTVGPGSGYDQPVTVKLQPTSRGAKSCLIVARDGAGAALASFTATGTGLGPAIAVLPTSFDFGSVRVATAAVTTATKTFAISNTGDAGSTLTVSNITFSDPDYALQPAPSFPLTILSGASQNVTVVFNPSSSGTHLATMTLLSDDPSTPMKGVALVGVGTNAIIAAADVNLGTVNNGATGNQSVAVSNAAPSSPGVLTVTSATITGGGGFFSFGTTQGCTGTTSCTFTQPFTVTNGTLNVPVRCQPPAAAAGTQVATVTLVSDSDPGGDATAQLTCTAGRPNILVSTNTLAFGNVAVGSASAAQSVTIMNTGNVPLTYSLSKTPNVAQYAISGCTASCSIVAGGMATFNVTFSPTAIGILTTRIDITSNDPDPGDSPFAINASGTGAAPQISVAPPGLALAFANTEVNRTSTAQTVTATNTGNSLLTISSATFSTGAADYTAVTGQTGSQTIAAGGSAIWTLACNPSAQGARPGKFRIASDSLTGATTDVTLTCTGEQGIAATVPTSLDFLGVSQGVTKSLSFTLRNNGNVPISGFTAVLDKTTVGYQFDATTLPATLAAGASKSLNVTFAPQSGNDGGPATLTLTAGWGSNGATATAVLTLNGDGLAAGYDITPATTFAFGNFRFDTTPQIVYHIVNTGQVDVAILTQAFTPNTGTATNEIGLVIRKAGAIVGLPQTLAMAEQLDVTVTAQPSNRIGLIGGKIDIHSNFAMAPDRQVTLTGNATSAALTAPMVTDFGGVDIDGTKPAKTVDLTNTGTAPLDITSIMEMVGASPAFGVTLPSGVTRVVPGDKLTLTITYTPTVERPPNQFDTAVLVANLSGVIGGPAQAMITLQGRGIDRHLVVDSVEAFPPAFRNPGDQAPVNPITVHNNGEATLRVSALMIAGDPVWQLVDASPIDIPGGGAHDFLVKFLPTTIGAAPEGQLTLVNNDNGNAMATVRLTGNGIGRNVAFTAGPISLGYTGIGIPVTAGDLLAVTNMDPGQSFKIHAIELTEGSPFRIEDAPADVELTAMAAKSFAITFEPTAAGHFETTATLYLDQDHEQQAAVQISGDALFVDVSGSGGCNTGSTGRGGLVVGLAALGVLGRRRRTGRVIAAFAVVTTMFATGPAVRADGIGITVFEPTPATTGTAFQLQSPDVGVDGDWVASTTFSYASNPLVLHARDPDGTIVNNDTLIERSSLLQLGAAYAFLGRFEAGAHLPLFMQRGEPRGDPHMGFTASPASGTARGNLTLHAKARLWRGGGGLGAFVAGASAAVVVPTASKDQFAGSDKLATRLLLLGLFTPAALASRLGISANAGAVIRGKSVYANIVQQSGIAWGASVSYRILDQLWATAEVFGEATPSGKRQQAAAGVMPPALALSPVEWLAGASYKIDARFTIGFAGGRGLTNGLGTPDLRGVLSLAFVPNAPAIAPIHPPEAPKPDGDGDGIPDDTDKCPSLPEDRNGIADDDGCPDLDSDHDGIPDWRDKCAAQAEDKDGFQDGDGCPDPDNDGDGVPDAQDKCPGQPETINGINDDDGCPDVGGDTSTDGVNPDQSPAKAAEQTFFRGRELMAQQKYFAACAAFEQSQHLDPAAGTQYNLAGCYAQIGKLATAWTIYRELARTDKNAERRAKSDELATQLTPRVPKLKMILKGTPAGVNVFMNGTNVNALIGIEAPVDFGTYTIVAGGPNARGWRQTVEVKKEGEVTAIEIDLGMPSTP